MRSLSEFLVLDSANLRDALKKIESSRSQFAVIADPNKKLLGTLSDGDIRRALLAGLTLDDSVTRAMNHSPQVKRLGEPGQDLEAFFRLTGLRHLPVVNELHQCVGVEVYGAVAHVENPIPVLVMAGGRGQRLMPYTEHEPKPLLRVGGRPMLERLIEQLVSVGLNQIWVSLNYKPEKIKEYFGDGSRFGAQIKYLLEDKPLGTAGSIALLDAEPSKSLLVLNADLVTEISFRDLLAFHESEPSGLTVAIREIATDIPYGVVTCEGDRIKQFTEKPILSHDVAAGIYVLGAPVRTQMEKGKSVDMPELVKSCIEEKKASVRAFRLNVYWRDVGRPQDLEAVNQDHQE